jgi:uncharacterized protein
MSKGKKKVTANRTTKRERELEEIIDNTTTLWRANMMRALTGSTIPATRDLNFECGYPDTLDASAYRALYNRFGIATRVVNVEPESSWSMAPVITENRTPEETEFEKAWEAVLKDTSVYHYLQRVDILSGIGRFGVLLIGIDDGKPLNEPVDGINEVTGKAKGTPGKAERNIIYMKPFDEDVVQVQEREADHQSPRFGFPTMYSIEFEGVDGAAATQTRTQVHWTRVLHVADNREVSETFGVPRLQDVYNYLVDTRKVLSGSGEMFWQGGFPGLSIETNPDVQGTLDTDSIKEQVQNYMHSMQRYLTLDGTSAKSLQPQVADPKGHLDAQITAIAITKGYPKRILMGSEEAKLASSQDVKSWNKRVSVRRENYVTPMVLRPFIDRLMALRVLPTIEEYFIVWPDLESPSDIEKAEVADKKTQAMAKYVAGTVDELMPPEVYFDMVLGMSPEEIDAVIAAAKTYISEFGPDEPEPGNDNNTDGG